jgi:hypothetical protein
MKTWFSLTLVCWAWLCLLLSFSQQAGQNHPLQVVGSGPWFDRCKEPASGSPTASVLRNLEFDQARAGPLESLAPGRALTAHNIGPPCQDTHGPPEPGGPWRVADQNGHSKQHRATLLHEFTGSTDRI